MHEVYYPSIISLQSYFYVNYNIEKESVFSLNNL